MLKFLFETNSTLPRIFNFCEASYVYKKIIIKSVVLAKKKKKKEKKRKKLLNLKSINLKMIIRPKFNILKPHFFPTIFFFKVQINLYMRVFYFKRV